MKLNRKLTRHERARKGLPPPGSDVDEEEEEEEGTLGADAIETVYSNGAGDVDGAAEDDADGGDDAEDDADGGEQLSDAHALQDGAVICLVVAPPEEDADGGDDDDDDDDEDDDADSGDANGEYDDDLAEQYLEMYPNSA